MTLITCAHKETIQTNGNVEVGVCGTCGQVRKYTKDIGKTAISKLGRIGGDIVRPEPSFLLALSSSEAIELREAAEADVAEMVAKNKLAEVKTPDPPKVAAVEESQDHIPVGSTERAPVPPKPAVGGAGSGNKNKQINLYYEANKATILKDLAELGEEEMRKRWDISGSTWRQDVGLAARWGIVVPRVEAVTEVREKSRVREKEFEKNKDEIIQDYLKLRLRDFLKKYHISSQGWAKIRDKWKVTKVSGHQVSNVQQPDSTEHIGLPSFPIFNNKWRPDVQIAWIEAYSKLRGIT